MTDSTAIVSAVAAVVSAAGGAFAAIAAFRAAGSAREALDSAQASEKRSALRQLSLTANEVLVEARRADSRAAELILSYQTLFVFGGSSGSSRESHYLGKVDDSLSEINKFAELARPFATHVDSLINGPFAEISSRETRMAQLLIKVRAIREDLEREHAFIEGQCTTYRQKVVQGKSG